MDVKGEAKNFVNPRQQASEDGPLRTLRTGSEDGGPLRRASEDGPSEDGPLSL